MIANNINIDEVAARARNITAVLGDYYFNRDPVSHADQEGYEFNDGMLTIGVNFCDCSEHKNREHIQIYRRMPATLFTREKNIRVFNHEIQYDGTLSTNFEEKDGWWTSHLFDLDIRADAAKPEKEKKLREEITGDLAGILKNGKGCKKHPLSCVIESAGGKSYIFGYNGAPEGIAHYECARKGLPSGHGMELCTGIHSERRAISVAAKEGIRVKGGTIYMSEWFPCADCAKSIVESGIRKLVTPDQIYEDKANHVLIEKLRKQPYNFEMADKVISEAGIEVFEDLNNKYIIKSEIEKAVSQSPR